MKTAGLNCLKYLVFFFNLLFFLCGLAALGIGIWAVVNEQAFKQILTNNSVIFNGVYIIIAAGAALTLIGFLGCCGAIKENRCLLGTFFTFLLIIFIAELAGAIYIYVKRDEVLKEVQLSMGKYGDGTSSGTAIKQGWDSVQNSAQCCGVQTFSEWKNNTKWARRFPGKLVPNSCCKRKLASKDSPILNVAQCQKGDVHFINTEGCLLKFGQSIQIVAMVGGVLLVVELLGMIFVCCLYKNLNNYKKVP